MITQRRDEEGLKQGGGCGGEGRQKPWESLVRITARIGERNVELGSDFFLCALTFLCLLFPYLEIGHNATWPASLGCSVRFDDQEGPVTQRS